MLFKAGMRIRQALINMIFYLALERSCLVLTLALLARYMARQLADGFLEGS